VTPLDHPLLTDENIHPEVVNALRQRGKNVRTVTEERLAGRSDLEILRRARATGRVIVTHDSDFGALAVRDRERFVGIVYIRPGHIDPEFVLGILASVEANPVDATPPFIVVAERRGDEIRVRQRSMA
jgi:predicted nuclease of predicted toxin-antitoxin system